MGAEVVPGRGVHFRVWAPRREQVEVVLDGGHGALALGREGDGYFSALAPDVREGALYRYRLDGEGPFPDPASRFQPEGPHGPSRVVDPARFRWSDAAWRGPSLDDAVIYELHVGAFTREGTWAAAARELPELRRAGLTVLELMPVAEFPGRFGWGYDGVDLFAPTRLYGEPDDLRRFIDEAHAVGLAVILDVVYNHLGPDGNYLKQYADGYFSDRYPADWGEPLDFEGAHAGPVREFVVANAGYWIDEFHFDGLRLDATQSVFDASPRHVLVDVARRVRAAAGPRRTLLVAENEPQHARLVRPESQGGYGLDAMWNDDYHHSARVAATGRREAYYTDTRGTPQELVSAIKYGFLFQGQVYHWQRKRRGTPALDLDPRALVVYLQNHDQVANSARGTRLHQITSPGRYRALTALTLLAPGTPMLFMGQEFGASTPFLYFADHRGDLATAVRKGREEFLSQFPSTATDEARDGCLTDPADPATFERCRLDLGERETNAAVYDLHKDLLRLRRDDPVFARRRPRSCDGAVLAPEALALRYFGEAGDDRLLLVNLGPDLTPDVLPEPLLAPPEGRRWVLVLSTEHPRYGGGGTPEVETEERWSVLGHSAVWLAAAEVTT